MKTRSPNLYERYVWSNSNTMIMNMNNLYGDGNGYVGNLNLKPEIAHTFSARLDWHDSNQEDWNVKVTPYFTYVDHYIDAVTCNEVGKTCAARTDGVVNLSLDNQSARLYGIDISGNKTLASGNGMGKFNLSGALNYVRGKNNTSHDNLYNIMPLNVRLALAHQLGATMGTGVLHGTQVPGMGRSINVGLTVKY